MSTKYYLMKRGAYYQIGWVEGDRRKWRTTKCTTKSEALVFLKSFETQNEKKVEPLRLSQFTELFRTRINGTIRKSTLRPYLASLKSFESVISDKLMSEYNVDDIENYKQKRLQSISPTTLNIELRSLKSTFNSAVKWELLKENPFRKVSLLKIPQRPPIYLTKEDFKKLISVVKEPLLRDVFLFAVLTGFRKGEMLNLKWSGVDLQKRQVTIENSEGFTTKSGKSRTIPLNDAVFDMLSKRNAERNRCEYVFHRKGYKLNDLYLTHRFKKYVVDLGLNPQLHLHSCRHTAASWLVDAGVSLYIVQNILGHANIATTQIYSHLSQNTLQESVNKVSL
jgi:site-specific recombinase XerD